MHKGNFTTQIIDFDSGTIIELWNMGDFYHPKKILKGHKDEIVFRKLIEITNILEKSQFTLVWRDIWFKGTLTKNIKCYKSEYNFDVIERKYIQKIKTKTFKSDERIKGRIQNNTVCIEDTDSKLVWYLNKEDIYES